MTLSKGDIINLSAPGPNMISSAMSLVFNIPLLFEIDILLLLKNIGIYSVVVSGTFAIGRSPSNPGANVGSMNNLVASKSFLIILLYTFWDCGSSDNGITFNFLPYFLGDSKANDASLMIC